MCNNDQEDKKCTKINSALNQCWHCLSVPEGGKGFENYSLYAMQKNWYSKSKGESISARILMRERKFIFLLSGKFLGWVNPWNWKCY